MADNRDSNVNINFGSVGGSLINSRGPIHSNLFPAGGVAQDREGTYVFISHLNEDKPRLGAPLRILLDAGVPLWIDRPEECDLGRGTASIGRIRSGDDWREAISRALDQAGVILAIWSRAALAGRREEFRREIRRGMERNVLVMATLDRHAADGRPLLDLIDPLYSVSQILDLSPTDGAAVLERRLSSLASDLRHRLGILAPAADAAPVRLPDGHVSAPALVILGWVDGGTPVRLEIDPEVLRKGGEYIVGRKHETADIVIADGRISAQHAGLRLINEQIHLRDLGSSNGTFIDGRRIGSDYEPLNTARTIALADILFCLDWSDATAG